MSRNENENGKHWLEKPYVGTKAHIQWKIIENECIIIDCVVDFSSTRPFLLCRSDTKLGFYSMNYHCQASPLKWTRAAHKLSDLLINTQKKHSR